MAGTTAGLGLPYLEIGDAASTIASGSQNLAEAVDDQLYPWRGWAQRSAPSGYSNNTTSNSWISINFNVLDQADSGFAGNGRGIQVTTAGLYLVHGWIGFDNSSGSRGMRVYVGPTDTTGTDYGAFFVTYLVNAHRLSGTWMVEAAANDTIYVQHYATATPTVSTGGTPTMIVRRLA